MPECILLTGASGFIGGQLVRRLVSAGHDVHLLVRPGGNTGPLPDDLDVTVHRDPGTSDALDALLRPLGITTCFHLATHFVAQHSGGDVDALIASNVGFGTRLADALAASRACVFVNAGTAWQHVESESYRPASLYAASKQAFEAMLEFYGRSGRLKVVHLKLYDTYGPTDQRRKLVNLLLDAARDGTQLEMSPGEQLIDLLHVDDALTAFLAAAREATPNSIVRRSASSGQPRTLRDVVATVELVTGRAVDVEFGARPYREIEMFTPWAAGPSPAGWAPTISLESGLADLWTNCADEQ